ncbi:sigma-70 family RNA polymerase sigma factor [Tundrisphaera lichenicola]|uniref:sigma-70 family RNA polymerase sigma factor n=1 Tax=Tundrisphaera lichenicola TaxID=2029860 RepID=UPI003EBC237C
MAMELTATEEEAPTPQDRRVFETWPDGQLLGRFLSGADEWAELAFAALIERHGPVVHQVCLEILRDREEARDATQAVFLVLARKAGSIRKPASLGPWLHGVALRVARRGRGESARRKIAERKRAELMGGCRSEKGFRGQSDDLGLREEVGRLPEKYREPILLCYWEGWTQEQAAEALGWPLGTVQSRLHRGLERLRSRLGRKGASFATLAGLGLAAGPEARAALLDRVWIEETALGASRFAKGRGTTGLISPGVTGLAESTLSSMFYDPIKIAAPILLVLLLAATALRWSGRPTREGAVEPPRSTLGPVKISPTPAPIPPKPRVAAIIPAPKGPDRAPAVVPMPPSPVQPEDEGDDFAKLMDPLRPSPGEVRPAEAGPSGRELFERTWSRNDPRSHGGDGLGPVFNGSSCVACHHLGGVGGAGGIARNVEIATVSSGMAQGSGYFYSFSMDFGSGQFDYRMGNAAEVRGTAGNRPDPRMLGAIHPGFRQARSVMLHQFGTDPGYDAWRGSVPGQHGMILVRTSERNSPPLFGSGLIDAIPDEAILAASRRRRPGPMTPRGRVSRLGDGRIGRFGWKAQAATLEEFVKTAAAGEIGLEVPGVRQAVDPRLPGLDAPGLDMDRAECDALVKYVRDLPAPNAPEAADAQEAQQIRSGLEAFKSIGCAHCHSPRLGDVEGIYSDLLLHDMSPALGDSDSYAVFAGDAPAFEDGARDRSGTGLALAQEWRTPPLWGLRDSGPYLHDGRAESIEQAIAMHGGQGAASARRHAELSPRRKRDLATFLRSLAAPSPHLEGR